MEEGRRGCGGRNRGQQRMKALGVKKIIASFIVLQSEMECKESKEKVGK